jgi:putative redox protein
MAIEDRPIQVRYLGGDRLRIDAGGHTLFSDQPVEDGGEGTAPSPTEIFVAGLAGCIAFYAERFLRRHHLSTEGLTVSCGFGWAENPHRVGEIAVDVEAPGLVPEKREAFERVIDHCTVHSTLRHEPQVRVSLKTPPATARVA